MNRKLTDLTYLISYEPLKREINALSVNLAQSASLEIYSIKTPIFSSVQVLLVY